MTQPQHDWARLQAAAELDVYGKRGITLVRGEGSYVYDDEGRRYVDCVGGQGALILGHGHPAFLAALQEQAKRLISCSGSFVNDARARYLSALVAAAPTGLTKAFLCNSGTEAVEAALKFARVHTGRQEILAFDGAFHGRTMGALSATANAVYRTPFQPLVPGFAHLPFNDLEALARRINAQTAAVILEVVQGEGGVHAASGEFVKGVRELCHHHGALMICDEVQTGFGRTGRMFGCERHGVTPDLMCLAKGIANGFPMGAVLAQDWLKVPVGSHGSTFGGNPLACALGLATLNELQQNDLPSAAERKGEWLRGRLGAAAPLLVSEIRGHGLMLGMELRTKVRPVLEQLSARGVLALAAGPRVLRLLPPLTIGEEALGEVSEALLQVLDQPWQAEAASC